LDLTNAIILLNAKVREHAHLMDGVRDQMIVAVKKMRQRTDLDLPNAITLRNAKVREHAHLMDFVKVQVDVAVEQMRHMAHVDLKHAIILLNAKVIEHARNVDGVRVQVIVMQKKKRPTLKWESAEMFVVLKTHGAHVSLDVRSSKLNAPPNVINLLFCA